MENLNAWWKFPTSLYVNISPISEVDSLEMGTRNIYIGKRESGFVVSLLCN